MVRKEPRSGLRETEIGPPQALTRPGFSGWCVQCGYNQMRVATPRLRQSMLSNLHKPASVRAIPRQAVG